jgi:hypothetical protein
MYQQLPVNVFKEKSLIWTVPIESQEFARRMDGEDQFASFRELFSFPKKKDLPFGKFLFNFYFQYMLIIYLNLFSNTFSQRSIIVSLSIQT